MSLYVEWQGACFRASLSDIVQNGGIRSVFGGLGSGVWGDGCSGFLQSSSAQAGGEHEVCRFSGVHLESDCDGAGLLGRDCAGSSCAAVGCGVFPGGRCRSDLGVAVEIDAKREEKSRSGGDLCDAVASGASASLKASAVDGDSSCVRDAPFPVRGRFWERNLRKRRARKERKMAAANWRSDIGAGDRCVEEPRGFWNSCSSNVRQELIESKARMHVAENQRREAEARAKVEYLASPEALIRKAVDLQLFAEKKVSGVADNKVSGWARTVASASVESLAKTAPSTVPSFDEVVKELDSISVTEAERVRAAREQEVKEMQDMYQARLSAVMARVADLELEKSSSEASSATRVEDLEKQVADLKAEKAIDYKTKFLRASHDKYVLEERLARFS